MLLNRFLFVLSFCLFVSPLFAQVPSSTLQITALDETGKPLVGVKLALKKAGVEVGTTLTDEKGQATLSKLAAGTYEIIATKEGLEPRTKSDLVITPSATNELELVMVPKVSIADTVNVNASTATTNPVEQGASVSTDINRQQAKDTAIRPHTVADALPLVPGVVRDGQGQLHINGAAENRNALLVNAMDVTDPATGQLIEGDIRVQTERVLNNAQAVLEAAGSSLDRVVKTTVFLADMNDFTAMNEVYATFFGATRPARSTVQAARLPRDVKVEIEVVALV